MNVMSILENISHKKRYIPFFFAFQYFRYTDNPNGNAPIKGHNLLDWVAWIWTQHRNDIPEEDRNINLETIVLIFSNLSVHWNSFRLTYLGLNETEPVRVEVYRKVYLFLKEKEELDQVILKIVCPRGGPFQWTLSLSYFQRQVIQFEDNVQPGIGESDDNE
eukprot:NODE_912_length_3098_cov_0.494832.p1 type:complete len:162 gc:universal NODE_912_length_3098_cov_0.494832:119-604(+)